MSRARAFLADIGVDVAVCYGAFAVMGLFVNLLSTGGIVDTGVTLANLLSGDLAQAAFGGGSGRGVFLVLLATATIAVPYVWKHRVAKLAFVVPLLVTLLAFWPLYLQQRRQQDAVHAMGELGQGLGELAVRLNAEVGGPLTNLRTATWLLIATVLFLAFRGVARTLASR